MRTRITVRLSEALMTFVDEEIYASTEPNAEMNALAEWQAQNILPLG